jgi:hypothetical protein
VIRALQLKGSPSSPVPVKSPSDFKRWNPQPANAGPRSRGERVYDSTFILPSSDEWAPEPPLCLARRAHRRAPALPRKNWSDESLYWYVMALPGTM